MNADATEGLERLYRQVGPALLAYLRNRHADPQIAEDLLQDTFMQAARHPERLVNASAPRAYLFGIARNLSCQALRRTRPQDELPADLRAADDPATDPRLEPMRQAITRLPAVQGEVLHLRLQQELTYEEIAHVLGIPIGTVRSRLHEAVRRLRAALAATPAREV